ncbi:MAG: ABC transporter permease [Sarcina sp.]
MEFIKEFKTYFAFSKGNMKTAIAYKANILMGLIGQIILVTVTFFLWKAIYSSSLDGVIKGFSLEEMLIYVMMSFIVGIITSSSISYVVAREVRDGSIAMNLIKPIKFRRRLVFMGIGEFLISFITIFLPSLILIIIYTIQQNRNINVFSLILFFISVCLGFLINTYYSYLFGLLAFKFYNLWGISQISSALIRFISGMLIPLTFFPDMFQKIFGLLPFSSIIYIPTMIYLGKLSPSEILISMIIQVFWIIIFIILSKVMWTKLIDTLSIQGG